mgnify:CR=1 FL=1
MWRASITRRWNSARQGIQEAGLLIGAEVAIARIVLLEQFDWPHRIVCCATRPRHVLAPFIRIKATTADISSIDPAVCGLCLIVPMMTQIKQEGHLCAQTKHAA